MTVPTPLVRRRRAMTVRAAGFVVAAAATAVVVLIGALVWGGGAGGPAVAGLPDAGRLTRLGLPVVRAVGDGCAVLTVGWCVTAAFLLPGLHLDANSRPGDARLLGPAGYRMLRGALWPALGWAAASLALLPLTVSDLLGQPAARVSLAAVRSLAVSVGAGRVALAQAVAALVVAVACRWVLTRSGAALVALVALAGVLPPALTGHAAGAGNHQIAVTSLAVHLAGVALWVGGLAALLALRGDRALAVAAPGFSRLAAVCFAAVAASGIANAAVRLGSLDQLWRSRYGLLVCCKIAALVVLGLVGAAHRSRTLPALRAGRSGALLRLAAGETLVFAGALGLGVALARTPTPVPANPVDPDPVTDLLGFAAPGPLTAVRALWPPLPDAFFLVLVAVGAWAYLAGVLRLRRDGHRWPALRTVSWLAGLVALAGCTLTGVARYAYVLFSVHMAQHMALTMLVPVLLVGGAPLTLALRALRRTPHGGGRALHQSESGGRARREPEAGVRGAREWLLLVLRSRFLRVLTHPAVALANYVVSLYALYLGGGLLTALMRTHVGHLAMLVHFVLAGFLFFWVLIGVDPGRRRVPPPLLILIHFVGMAFHAFLGVALLQTRSVIAAGWYASVHPAWAPGLLADQHLAGALAWSLGEVPAVGVLVLLVVRWIRDDEREQRRLDRAADRAETATEDDALARYNDFLRRAAQETVGGR